MSYAKVVAQINKEIAAHPETEVKPFPTDINKVTPQQALDLIKMLTLDVILSKHFLKGEELEAHMQQGKACVDELQAFVVAKIETEIAAALDVEPTAAVKDEATAALAHAARH